MPRLLGRSRIRENYCELERRLDCSDLMTKMYSKRVVNDREKDQIESQLERYKQNGKLLQILETKSDSEFNEFVTILKEEGLTDLAIKLETVPPPLETNV